MKKISHSNLTKWEKNTLYLLRDDASIIIIKEAEVGVVWDREHYLREANSQLSDKDVYREVKGEAEDPLMRVMKSVLEKIRNRDDINDETLDYFLVNKPKVNVPERPAISNSSYFTENISFFLDFYLKPLSQKVKSYVQDTNNF